MNEAHNQASVLMLSKWPTLSSVGEPIAKSSFSIDSIRTSGAGYDDSRVIFWPKVQAISLVHIIRTNRCCSRSATSTRPSPDHAACLVRLPPNPKRFFKRPLWSRSNKRHIFKSDIYSVLPLLKAHLPTSGIFHVDVVLLQSPASYRYAIGWFKAGQVFTETLCMPSMPIPRFFHITSGSNSNALKAERMHVAWRSTPGSKCGM
jgi:hypothetical protein